MNICESCRAPVDPARAIDVRVAVVDKNGRERLLCVPCWCDPSRGKGSSKEAVR